MQAPNSSTKQRMEFSSDKEWYSKYPPDEFGINSEEEEIPGNLKQVTSEELSFEFDVPKFVDFVQLRKLYESYGTLALREEERISERKYRKWFERYHLEHEHEQPQQPVNLLLQASIPDEISDQQALHYADFMASFAGEFDWNENTDDENIMLSNKMGALELSKKPKKNSIFKRFKTSSIETSSSPSSRISTNSKNRSRYRTSPRTTNSDNTHSNENTNLSNFLWRNITRRKEIKADAEFISAHDAVPGKLFKVHPKVCSIPTDMKTMKQSSKKIEPNDVKQMLQSFNDHTRALRQVRSAQIHQEKQNAKLASISGNSVNYGASSSLASVEQNKPRMQMPKQRTAKQHHQIFKQESRMKNQENEILGLLKKHNIALKNNR